MQHSPRESALNRARLGEQAELGTAEYLLVGVLNQLRHLSWQWGAKEGDPPPEPLLLPGMTGDTSGNLGDLMSIEEMDARLAKYLPGAG